MRSDWAVVLAAWALLLAAATLLTAGTLYAHAVAVGGLRTSVLAASLPDRSVRVLLTARTADLASLDPIVTGDLDGLLAAGGGGDRLRFIQSGPLGFAADAATTSRFTNLVTRPAIDAHTQLASGRWASAGATPREATVSVGAAAALGVRAGETVRLVDRVHPGTGITLLVTGTWTADARDPYWLGSTLDLAGTATVAGFTAIGPIVVPEADLLAGEAGTTFDLEWRAIPDVNRLTVDGVEPLAEAAASLQARLDAAMPGISPQVLTGLPTTLAATSRSVLVSRSGIVVLTLEFGVVAAYAIVLVAGLLGDRRRTETALIRSRGGSSWSVTGMAVLEAVILAGAAAAIAPLVSLGVIRILGMSGPLAALGVSSGVGLGPDAVAADLIGAGAGVIAMTLSAAVGSADLAGVRAAMARPLGRTLGQRLGLDLALVLLAGIALWQLRTYGAPLTRNLRGVLGVDPVLVAAPAIGLIAGAVLATRLVPRLAEVAEPILARGRGLVGALGGRAVARRPLRYTRSALLLMLAAALGTFSIAHVATWTRSQADQAAYQAGADVRIVGTRSAGVQAASLGPAYRALPEATAAMPVDRLTVDSGRSIRDAPLLALDGKLAASIVADPGGGGGPALWSLLPQLGAADVSRGIPRGIPVPATARRIRFVIDAALAVGFNYAGATPPDLAADRAIRIGLVLEAADGRTYNADTDLGRLAGPGQPLEASLPAGGPFTVQVIELTVAPSDPNVGVIGSVEITSVASSDEANGDAWTRIDPFPPTDGAWTMPGSNGDQIYRPPAGHPALVRYGQEAGLVTPPFGAGGSVSVRLSWQEGSAPLTAIVNGRFLELTSAAVGDELPATIQGLGVTLRIIGSAPAFPTLDPAQPFALVDGAALAADRSAQSGVGADPGEWWVATTQPAAAAAAVAAGPDPGATVISRVELERSLVSDPSALGVLGLLGIGSAAALIFAAIGFVVSAAISTSERAGELALLRALGLSAGQAARWLSLEHAFLLVIGIGTGLGLGGLLAWLVLPFSALTRTGEPAVPTPTVIVPLDGLLPILGVAVAILVVTTAVLRRHLRAARIGEDLRTRAE
jgi:hypothetical protein